MKTENQSQENISIKSLESNLKINDNIKTVKSLRPMKSLVRTKSLKPSYLQTRLSTTRITTRTIESK